MSSQPKPPQIPDGTIRPLIVESSAGSRLGLGVLLQRQPWVARCLLATDGLEGGELARRHRPEVALLDVSDAGPFVASAVAVLRDAHPPMQIVLTSRCARNLNAPPHRLGAAGFLPPDASAEEIIAAVHGAVLTGSEKQRPRARSASSQALTERERQLLALISTGATNREIANRLHLGPDSIKKNASTLYRKLGVRNRTEAAQRAAELLAATGP